MPGSKRRANHEGTVEQLPSGRFKAYTRSGGVKISANAATKTEALIALRKKLKSLSPEGRSSLSFTNYARLWMSESGRLEDTTRDTYNGHIKAIEQTALGKIPIGQITEIDLKAWKRAQTGAKNSIRGRLGFIHQILRSIGNHARTNLPKGEDHERRPLTPAERTKLLEAFHTAEPRVQMALMIAWNTGLRRGEICGLKFSDLEDGGIWVKRVVVVTNAAIKVKPRPKTSRSRGWVPLPANVLELMESGTSGYVLTGTERPMHPKTLTNLVAEFMKDAGLTVPYQGLHALRRTYGMMMLEQGVDVVTAAKAMRHDPAMLLKEYARSRNDLTIAAVNLTFGDGQNAPRFVPKKVASGPKDSGFES
mgnify:CR=1 FL=1